MDNSFLIEEAYNQEPGVIQHIQTFQYLEKSNTWEYSFIQEWPVLGQRHQLSYTIPVNYLNDPVKETNIGDVALNYRYQLIFQEAIALAPRFSMLFPTGDYKEGFGSGVLGYEVNIPLSLELSHKLVNHWNAGTTIIPGSKAAGGADADTFGFGLGTSLIWLVSENFNLMCEAVWNSPESVQMDGTKTRNDTLFINPGARFAINFESGLQVVPGIAFPIGVGPSKDEYGVFLYLSFEHPFF
ncbi:MAG: transporter [Planctomycetes bacterium]|nr:transporter [Planctomycetota bacterium]